jgi:hypothetical protein
LSFDPLVEAIRRALRAVDHDPRSVPAYLALIEAYERCADQEGKAELLEQAGFVIRDVRKLPMSEDQVGRLEALEGRVAAVRARLLRGPAEFPHR